MWNWDLTLKWMLTQANTRAQSYMFVNGTELPRFWQNKSFIKVVTQSNNVCFFYVALTAPLTKEKKNMMLPRRSWTAGTFWLHSPHVGLKWCWNGLRNTTAQGLVFFSTASELTANGSEPNLVSGSLVPVRKAVIVNPNIDTPSSFTWCLAVVG